MSILLFASCNQNTFDSEQGLLEYINDENHGYTQKKSVNGYDFVLTYRPTDLLVNQELPDKFTDKEITQLRDKYNKYLYFNLSMSKNGQELLSVAPENRNEFGAMVNQLAFGMTDKVHLYTPSKDTIQMADFVYPRMYGMSKATTMMFVFPKEDNALDDDYLNFTLEDLGIYTGEIKFKVPTQYIKEQPLLLFK